MCQHKKNGQSNNALNIDSISRAVWQEMGKESFDQAYKKAGSPRLRMAGKKLACSCDLINFVDNNIQSISKIAKSLGCDTDYRTLLSLTCYIENEARQPFTT